MQGSSQAAQSISGNQGQDSLKTSGANTPCKDGATTPPYRDKQQHISQIYNLTSMKLLHLQQQQQEERAVSAVQHNRTNSSTRGGGTENTPSRTLNSSTADIGNSMID